jgi:DNA-binding SARP family transcriptional activator/TolB-like protein/Flp pilus assembly protein TadD
MNSASAFRLALFGTPSLAAVDGHQVSGQAVQRHRIALLALLALTDGKGLSREKLVGYLWPERETEQARQLLNQAVYNLRKSLGDDAVLSDGDDLRLNREVVSSDVAEFEAALARRDLHAALALYSGPFLDGFFLTSAPEFERWVDRERARLTAAHAEMLEAAADAAAQRGDRQRAIELWKRRASEDPYDSRVALRLMEALAASGNHAGALQHARVHEQLLQSDFNAAAPPELTALAERLKTAPLSDRAPVIDRGLPNEDRSPTTDPPSPSTDHHSPAARYLLIAAALGTVGLGVFFLRPRPRSDALAAESRQPAIAVLPFANLSNDSRDAFLADGMTEEVIGTLAMTRGIRVIASTSVYALRDRHLDVRRIADSLHVSQVLEGDVQKSGTHLRVRVRLVDARDGETRWSETYDRELRDVFAVDDDIGRAVVRELGVRIGAAETTAPYARHQTRNVAAYEFFLRGSDPVLLRSDSGPQMAIAYFQQAIALDSSYTAAYAGLARLYLRQSLGGGGSQPRHALLLLAEETAKKAVALDDSLADAHGALALVKSAQFDLGAAESHLIRATELEPSRSVFHEWLSRLYVLVGEPSNAVSEARRAVDLDPLSPSANAELAHALLSNGRPDEALAQLQKVAALRPPLLRAAIIAAECYMKKGMWPQAISLLRPQADRGGAVALAHLGFALARTGSREQALRIRDTLAARWRSDAVGPLEVALVSAGLGDRDQAFSWLDRAIAAGSMSANGAELLFDELRPDPRFQRVRERMGLQKR